MNNKRNITLYEHGSLYVNNNEESNSVFVGIKQSVFDEVKLFVLENNNEVTQLLIPSYTKGYGETLKVSQYVGVIQTKSGVSIEILPKIARVNTKKNTKKILIKMLKTLRNSPFKNLGKSSIKTEHMDLLEVFITMFSEELANLVRRGLKSNYIAKEENTKFLKGKLKLTEHIRKNAIHKERFYVQFDEYLQNRVENRIIRTTLVFLYKKSRNGRNKKNLRELLFVFDRISPIHDYTSAFKKIRIDRQMKDYETILQWCKYFLQGDSFTPYRGNSVALALLFDMNLIFEDYVAHCLKKVDSIKGIRTQVSEKTLLISPNRFKLKPDLKYQQIVTGEVKNIIGDTKWKLLTSNKAMNQSDLYQMYAYGTKYDDINEIHLIYPYNEDFPALRNYKFENNLLLKVIPFDCKEGKFIDVT